MSSFSKLIVCAYEKRRLCRDCAHAGISCAGPYSVKMEDKFHFDLLACQLMKGQKSPISLKLSKQPL